MASRVTSIRLRDDLATRLDALAASLNRPRAWVIEQAIARYVDDEAWQVAAISEALAEYRTGESAPRPHGELMEWLEAKIRARAGGESSLASPS